MGIAQMFFDADNGFEAPRALIDVAIEPPNLEIMLVNQVEFHFSTVHGAERTFRHIANPLPSSGSPALVAAAEWPWLPLVLSFLLYMVVVKGCPWLFCFAALVGYIL